MGYFNDYTEWEHVNEYRDPKWHNIYKVMKSPEPIISEPVFTDDGKIYQEVQDKIEKDLKGYETHMKEAEVKMKEWRETAKGQKGEKGNLDWYAKADKSRQMAFDIVKKAAEFMKKYNELYQKVKSDMIGNDHRKVAVAIDELYNVYPYELIKQAGLLKRLKRMKYDGQFIKDVLKWTDSIVRNYETLIEGGKILGKTKNQIAGMKRQSVAQSMRWGMY